MSVPGFKLLWLQQLQAWALKSRFWKREPLSRDEFSDLRRPVNPKNKLSLSVFSPCVLAGTNNQGASNAAKKKGPLPETRNGMRLLVLHAWYWFGKVSHQDTVPGVSAVNDPSCLSRIARQSSMIYPFPLPIQCGNHVSIFRLTVCVKVSDVERRGQIPHGSDPPPAMVSEPRQSRGGIYVNIEAWGARQGCVGVTAFMVWRLNRFRPSLVK